MIKCLENSSRPIATCITIYLVERKTDLIIALNEGNP